jgi:gliding motility-associated protein GldM
MAGGKQTPRQKLISLMYLIFLALMALNVSVEVLDSFPLINESIEQTNKNFEIKVSMVYDDFDKQRANSEDKVQPYYDQAQYVRQIADSVSNYILHQRSSMIALLNGISIEEADSLSLFDMKAKDNYSTSSNFWLRENNQDPTRDGGRGTRAYELKEQLAAFQRKS